MALRGAAAQRLAAGSQAGWARRCLWPRRLMFRSCCTIHPLFQVFDVIGASDFVILLIADGAQVGYLALRRPCMHALCRTVPRFGRWVAQGLASAPAMVGAGCPPPGACEPMPRPLGASHPVLLLSMPLPTLPGIPHSPPLPSSRAPPQAKLYPRILAALKPGATLGLSHGFLLGVMQNDGVDFRSDINVVLVAPKVGAHHLLFVCSFASASRAGPGVGWLCCAVGWRPAVGWHRPWPGAI